MFKRLATLVAFVLLVAVPAAPASAADTSSSATDAARLLELVNQERAAAGLAAMEGRGDVASISLGHSQAMADRGEIWHNDAYFTSSTRQQLQARSLGENVAMNSTLEGAHRALMNSPGHRANILSPKFKVLGLGIARDARGVYFVTENFVEPLGAAAPAPAPAPAPAAKPAPAPKPAPVVKAAAPAPAPAPAAAAATPAPAPAPAPAVAAPAPVPAAPVVVAPAAPAAPVSTAGGVAPVAVALPLLAAVGLAVVVARQVRVVQRPFAPLAAS